MSFETIKIHRQFNVVNGFVQSPNNLEKNKSKDALEATLTSTGCTQPGNVVRLGAGTGAPRTAGIRGSQQIFELPGAAVNEIPKLCNGDNVETVLGDN